MQKPCFPPFCAHNIPWQFTTTTATIIICFNVNFYLLLRKMYFWNIYSHLWERFNLSPLFPCVFKAVALSDPAPLPSRGLSLTHTWPALFTAPGRVWQKKKHFLLHMSLGLFIIFNHAYFLLQYFQQQVALFPSDYKFVSDHLLITSMSPPPPPVCI